MTWSMTDEGLVLVDVHVELAFVTDAEQCVALGFLRLTDAFRAGRERVATVLARPVLSPSRVEQELEEILARATDRGRPAPESEVMEWDG